MQPGEAGLDVTGLDDERIVDLSDDAPLLDDAPTARADEGWDERSWGSDVDWLREQRPPHW